MRGSKPVFFKQETFSVSRLVVRGNVQNTRFTTHFLEVVAVQVKYLQA
jgi:hypothetical protein